MSISRQEEIISALWAVCALLAFGYGFTVWGWLFTVKAASDALCSVGFAIIEILAAKKATIPSTTTKP